MKLSTLLVYLLGGLIAIVGILLKNQESLIFLGGLISGFAWGYKRREPKLKGAKK